MNTPDGLSQYYAVLHCLGAAPHGAGFDLQAECLRLGGKMASTFGALLDGLDRHRSRGQQRVIVEHKRINIGPGAQAVRALLRQIAP